MNTAHELWQGALDNAVGLARKKLGIGAAGRISHAEALCREGHVNINEAGVCVVDDGESRYQINGACTCQESPVDGYCSHRIARGMALKAMEIAKAVHNPPRPLKTPYPAPGSGYTLDTARASVPEAYWPYLKAIGPGDTPYMLVSGRVRMAMDEHRAQGAALTIDTTYAEVAGKLVCRAYVTSAFLGSATGHAIVVEGATKGAEATNPLEVAETSAIGRALGFLGYGLFGGIASAEEMEVIQ